MTSLSVPAPRLTGVVTGWWKLGRDINRCLPIYEYAQKVSGMFKFNIHPHLPTYLPITILKKIKLKKCFKKFVLLLLCTYKRTIHFFCSSTTIESSLRSRRIWIICHSPFKVLSVDETLIILRTGSLYCFELVFWTVFLPKYTDFDSTVFYKMSLSLT